MFAVWCGLVVGIAVLASAWRAGETAIPIMATPLCAGLVAWGALGGARVLGFLDALVGTEPAPPKRDDAVR
jgi:hypothetical protein